LYTKNFKNISRNLRQINGKNPVPHVYGL
jgi:hypothetical protein